MVWFEDDQISAELVQMRLLAQNNGHAPPLRKVLNWSSMPSTMVATGDEYQNPCDC
ncbi:hypothetical protein ACVXHB_06035 [Escherichia coli]